ncbi:hypothetical protein KKG29_04325 [Patescibacteria group bacterium]|nr:hypothetical protein [Patescibacteria group bacterium]MBU4000367.1 hypothetical protein [Patescibacteria group bacterium]MBU4056450.1 hypothetical protein [Patescibacteria group bacterium]MBU4368842.1 hypothetical protein [Patescibacteria group bacterium]
MNFRILIQPEIGSRKWLEISNKGLVPEVPPIGTIIYIKGSNLNFTVHKVMMTAVRISEPEEVEKSVTLLQINPADENTTKEGVKIIVEDLLAKGWVIGDLADNTRRVLFGK